MTSDEFWHGEARLASSYREAEEIRRDNQLYAEMRAGRYVYEALLAASPALNAWSKGVKHEYPVEPVYTLSDENENKQRQLDKAQMDKNRTFMDVFMVNHNLAMQGE